MLNRDIVVVYNGLSAIRENGEIRFPARATFAMVRNLKLIQPIVEDLIVAKNKLLNEFGTEEADNPGTYCIPPENRGEFEAQMIALDEVDNEVSLYKIKWEDIENINLSIQTMEALYPMIEEEN